MKTIKVIDLLNKIANGEDLPKKIKYENELYYFSNDKKAYYNSKTHCLLECATLIICLNDEIEIIEDTSKEESKIPEKLKLYAPYPECDDTRFDDVEEKINEIIKYLESKEK